MKEKPLFKTERLYLRSIELNDSEQILRYRSDSVTNQYQGWIPESLNDVREFIDKKVCDQFDVFDTWFQFVILKNDDNQVIGDIGVHFLDEEKKQVELGFTLDKNQQGKGFAIEAVSAVIDYLFQELNKHRITASIDPRNINSIKLVERLGFRKEAHFKESIFDNGEWLDDVVYALLKNEWKN